MPAGPIPIQRAWRATEMTPARIRFLRKASEYTATIKPGSSQTHELANSFVEMLAADRDERVAVVVGCFVIAQSGSNTSSQALR